MDGLYSNLHGFVVIVQMTPDILSNVLGVLNAQGVRCTRLEASGDWALAFPAQTRLKFVALSRGACWILLPDQLPQPLTAGDVFLIGDTPYAVASSPEVIPVDGVALYNEPSRDLVRLGGDETVALGGGIAFRGEAEFLLEGLPQFLRVDGKSLLASAVARTLNLLEAEISHEALGGALVTMRLAEVLLVEAIRAYVADQGDACAGWIGALGDRQIGEALRLIHGDVAHPWTVAMLATQVGMSRSAFSARFADRVGRPPLDYLRHWRMVLARKLLDEDRGDVASVALKVGYVSQSAFGHAFKRTFGHSPGRKLARVS